MKRKGYLFPQICDITNLQTAHQNARKGKGWYKEVKMVNENPQKYLTEARELLINKDFHTSEYTVYVKRDYKKDREIFKLPYYPDRIVQWALLQVIEPYLINTIISDTYSAIPKRGVHLALEGIKKDMYYAPEGTVYCFKADVRKYYPSIPHDRLKQSYRRIIKDPEVLWLIDDIIDSTDSCEEQEVRRKRMIEFFSSLTEYDIEDMVSNALDINVVDRNVGVPIGNYMSQWSGNLYLSSFDHWIKEEKRMKYYYRYMDDIVILHSSKEYLHQLKDEIYDYLKDNMGLILKDNHQVFPVDDRGIDFLGYRIFHDYVLLRKSTAQNMKNRVREIWKTIDREGIMTFSQWCSINSYKGWLMYCDSYRLTQKYIAPLEPYANKFYKEVVLNGRNH